MNIPPDAHKLLKSTIDSMEKNRQPWLDYWRDLANFILPRRYLSLQTRNQTSAQLRNSNILDGTATIAAGVLAAGMLNGITSPSRPWFRLREISQVENELIREWLDDCERRMLYVMSESNFYTSMATIYMDISVFATSFALIYEDEESVFRCYNYALGEYFFLQNEKNIVDQVGIRFMWRVEQIVNRFGLENVSEPVRMAYTRGGGNLNDEFEISCLIQPNRDGPLKVAKVHKFRQVFWETKGQPEGQVLEVKGFRDWPGICTRWQVVGNDSYGTGPSAEALGDVKQLQHETKRKAQAIDFMIRPPLVADTQLQHKQTSILPGGITYVSGFGNNEGVRPIYQLGNVPIRELSEDISLIQGRIREFFYNDLFKMISQLDTVRSATEIDERVQEKLVLLGPVLERFENEALDPAINRIFQIMLRRGLLAEPPAELAEAKIEIQYVSVLNDAQRAVGAAPIERFVSFIGNIGALRPEVMEVPEWITLARDYGDRLGVPAKDMKTPDEVAERMKEQSQQQELAQTAEMAPGLAQAAKLASETPVGGGASALNALIGG